MLGRVEGERVRPDRAVGQHERDRAMRADDLVLGVERRVREHAGNARARGNVDLVLHHETAGLVVESSADRRHARPAAIDGGEVGLDGVKLDQVRVLDVLVGIVGADDIFPVLLVGAFELRVDHAQIAVLHLEAFDARVHVANADARGKARRNEIGGEHKNGEDRERLAQEIDELGVARGAREGAPALLDRADPVPLTAGNDIGISRHSFSPNLEAPA